MNKATFIPSAMINESLATPAAQGKRLLEPLKKFSIEHQTPIHILEDKEVSNVAEIHMHEADLWICISGEVTFTTGGILVNQRVEKDERELKGDAIDGGEDHMLHTGDILHIPAGVAHSHRTNSEARLYIIKIPNVGNV